MGTFWEVRSPKTNMHSSSRFLPVAWSPGVSHHSECPPPFFECLYESFREVVLVTSGDTYIAAIEGTELLRNLRSCAPEVGEVI
jgi:hypothetical protein